MIEQYDYLYNVEQILYKTRLMSNASLKNIGSLKLDIVVMYRIEQHKNYHISNLLKYAKIVNRKLYADDVLLTDLTDVGNLFKSKRLAAGLTKIDLYAKTNVLPRIISKIENGGEFNKSTLLKLLSFFPINFRIE